MSDLRCWRSRPIHAHFSFKFGRDASGRVYPGSGVDAGFHNASHHGVAEEKIKQFGEINKYHVSLLPYFLEKLKATTEGDANLLDKTLIFYGSPMAIGNNHNHRNCPSSSWAVATARTREPHVKAADDTPMANDVDDDAPAGLDDIKTFATARASFRLRVCSRT